MPSIVTASKPVTEFPNLFVSPFGNDGVIPLFSSVPIDNRTSGACLPCVVCGNSSIRSQVIAAEASKLQARIDDSTSVTLF
jgi:hypothetical protein